MNLKSSWRTLWHCARLPVFYASLVAFFVGFNTLLLRYVFAYAVMDPLTGLPSKETSLVFGWFTFFVTRSLSTATLYSKKFLIHPWFDAMAAYHLLFVLMMMIWIYLPQSFPGFSNYVGVFFACFPTMFALVPVLLKTPGMSYWTAFRKIVLTISIPHFLIMVFTFVIMVLSGVVGNLSNAQFNFYTNGQSSVVFAASGVAGNLSNPQLNVYTKDQTVQASIIIGFAYPVLKFICIKLQSMLSVWKKNPTTRAEEVGQMARDLIFIFTQELTWGIIGKILIMRGSFSLFLLSSILSGAFTVVERAWAVFLLLRSERLNGRKVGQVGESVGQAISIQPEELEKEITVERRPTEQNAQMEGCENQTSVAINSKSQMAPGESIKDENNKVQLTFEFSVDTLKNENRLQSLKRLGTDHSGAGEKSRSDSLKDRESSTSVAESRRERPSARWSRASKSSPREPEEVSEAIMESESEHENKEFTVLTITAESTESDDATHEPGPSEVTQMQIFGDQNVEKGIVEAGEYLESKDENDEIPLEDSDEKSPGEFETIAPFIPMRPVLTATLSAYGKSSAEWASRLISWIVIWLFCAVAPTSTWTSCYSNFDPTIWNIMIRIVISICIAIGFDVLAFVLETFWGGYDFPEAAEMFVFNFQGVYYVVFCVSSTLGVFIFSETGVVSSASSTCFLSGRR